MKKILTALVAALCLATATVAMPGTAEARWGWGGGGWHGGGWGRGWGWGGAAVAGAIVAGAIAAPYYYGPPAAYYGYSPYPYYGYGPGYGPGPACSWQTVWNGYAWVQTCM